MFMERVFPFFGAPRVVLSDRGPQFTAIFWEAIMRIMGTKVALATSHHPQTDRQSERMIQTLLRLVRTFASAHQNKWEEQLPLFELALNAVPSKATGLSPHEIVFGEPARVPLTMLNEEVSGEAATDPKTGNAIPRSLQAWMRRCRQVWQSVQDSQSCYNDAVKKRYDRNRREVRFEPGELVLLSTKSHAALEGTRKHQERYVGPYVVESQVHPNAYRLAGLPPGVPKTQNVQYLRRFHVSPFSFLLASSSWVCEAHNA